jgi:hypothetical protein
MMEGGFLANCGSWRKEGEMIVAPRGENKCSWYMRVFGVEAMLREKTWIVEVNT